MSNSLRDKFGAWFWNDKSDRCARYMWILLAVILAILAFVRPAKRTVTFHYSNATYHWWTKKDLYSEGGHGFLYFPQSVHLYAPFAWQKFPEDMNEFNERPLSETLRTHFRLRAGEAFFRICSVAFFAFAIYRLSGLVSLPEGSPSAFFSISLLSLPAAVTALANGQFNTLLAASLALAAVSVAREKWWAATVWLVFCVMVKPLGVVPLLLFGALYPRLWWRLPIGLVVFALLGFVHYNQGYVMEQWQDCIEKLRTASIPPGNRFDDIASLFKAAGMEISYDTWFIVRAIMAFLFLLVSFLLGRKTDRYMGPLLVGAAAATYLMLFNPRTETVSYHILATIVATLAAILFRRDKAPVLMWLFIFLCIGWGSDNYGPIYDLTRLWWKPFLALIFMGVLFYWAFAKMPVVRKITLVPAEPPA